MKNKFKKEVGKFLFMFELELFGTPTNYGTTNNFINIKLVPWINLARFPKEGNIYSIGVEWLNLHLLIGYKFEKNEE